MKLQPTATIIGRLLTEGGEPLPNFYIGGQLETGQLNLTRPRNAQFEGGPTDAKGRFKIEGVLPGVKLSAALCSRT